MDELEKLRTEAAQAIKDGADPEAVRHEFRRLAALLPEPQDAPQEHEGAGSTLGAFGRSVLATAANAAHGIPGMEAAQAGVRSLVRGQSFADARSDIRGETEKIPGALRVAGQIPGAIASTAIAPGLSPAKAGAAYGGLQQALSADDESLGERAGRTAVGAAAGAFIPKAIEGLANTGRIAATGVRSIGATTPARLLQNQEKALQAETGPMYDKALQEGRGAVVPPQVRAFLDRPEIKDISSRLQQLDRFKGMADDSPEMIQAINRALSDQAIALKNPANMVATGKGATNVGRAELDQITALKQELSRAVSTPGRMTVPAVTRQVPGTPAVTAELPAMETALTPRPASTREAIDQFNQRLGEAARRNPGNETTEQRAARELLERAGAYAEAPAISGARPGPRSVELSPEVPSRTEVVSPSIRTTVRPMMPSQRAADVAFARGKGEQQATQRGVNAVAAAQRGSTAGGSLNRSSPEVFERWVKQAPPREVEAFMQSVLGETGNRVRGSIKPDVMTVGMGLGGMVLGGPTGLAGAAIPAVIRAGKAATAGDRMLRAAKGLPRSASVPKGLTPTILDLLNEYTRR